MYDETIYVNGRVSNPEMYALSPLGREMTDGKWFTVVTPVSSRFLEI